VRFIQRKLLLLRIGAQGLICRQRMRRRQWRRDRARAVAVFCDKFRWGEWVVENTKAGSCTHTCRLSGLMARGSVAARSCVSSFLVY
jgi:hypothetical protein